MTTESSYSNFQSFVSKMYDSNSAEYELFNGYTTFMMCYRENRDNIKEHRKKWIVNNYTNYSSGDNSEYYNFYNKTVTDTYSGVFAPPPCFYNEILREEQRLLDQERKEAEEWYNDDIQTHYRDIANKYARSIERPQELNENVCDYDMEYSENETDYNTSVEDVEYITDTYDDYQDYECDDYEEEQYEDDYNDW